MVITSNNIQAIRLASELLTENADTAVTFLDGSVYLSGPGTPGIAVTRARAHIELSGLFERASLADLNIAKIYDISSVVAELYHSPNRSMSGAFQVSITAQTDLSSEVPFWDSKQQFVFRPVNDSWIITGILFGSGQQLPSDWSPAAVGLSPDTKEESVRTAAMPRGKR